MEKKNREFHNSIIYFSMNILFFKKFGGNSEKERIIIFVMESCDKMDWCNQDKYLYLRIPCYNCNTFRVDLT